jgi:hypothetical protein
MHTIVNPLGGQGVHLEASLIKTKHQLGIPSVDTEHSVAESPCRRSQGRRWVAISYALWSTTILSSWSKSAFECNPEETICS